MSDFLHHLRYHRWATARTLESVRPLTADELARNLDASFGGVYGTLTHIYQADKIWFDRLMERPTGNLAAYEPPAELGALEKDWDLLYGRYISWAEGLSETDWRRVIAYRDTKGNAYQNPVWQMVVHVVNHGSYHRGQVVSLLRQLGHKPVGTDLITYYRETAAAG